MSCPNRRQVSQNVATNIIRGIIMENDVYYRIIQELSIKSEKNIGLNREEGGKNNAARYITRGISLLLQLFFIAVISGFFAFRSGENSSLSINLYLVECHI